MMMRSGTRYLCAHVGAAQRAGSSSSARGFLVARALSCGVPSGRVSPSSGCVSWPRPAGAVAAVASRRLVGFPPLAVAGNANCGVLRLWSSGRASRDSKETAPLTGRDPVTSSSPVKDGEDAETELEQAVEDLPQQSWRERAKTFAIEYGRVGICTHIVLSVLSFSVIYVGVSSGVDVTAILESAGMSSSVSYKTTNSAGSFLIAYTLYKVLAPVRWPLTFAVTPVVLRALRRRGYMLAATNPSAGRSPPPPPQ